ncbi:FAD-linked reductase [Patellaria atrata CBS 101060]|uniref:FAD-linked reductase n=1 Tax=Patellaria atrata CBS 101060 TaxID=1346257 RepID=A0A9P4SJZ6_9PEZI|nr:FAD-linked reductase [Patellaria atrata CBS 101060]
MTNNDCTVTVKVDDGSGISKLVSHGYATVYKTTTMGALQCMDLSGLKLPEELFTGIRSLSYDRASKVVIVFSNPWWIKYKEPETGAPLISDGGFSCTDLLIHTVVYPSWNDWEDKPAVPMGSYTWTQDATRIGSLIPDHNTHKPSADDELVTLMLQNLSKIWSSVQGGPTFETLKKWYVTHPAYAWSHDPNTAGAFALFGPG